MDKQEAQKIVNGLKQAQAAGAEVVELIDQEARDFNWVQAHVRPYLLGSFCIEHGTKFFVVVASKNNVNFQFMVFERFKRSPILTTDATNSNGMVWTYSAAKQDGKAKNEARNQAFLEAAGAKTISLPFPTAEIVPFSDAVTRAIELRHVADAAGGAVSDDDETEAEEPEDQPAGPVRYWKIAPGKKGVNWDECRQGGFIGIGWNKLGDLTSVSLAEFEQRAADLEGQPEQVWTFRNIKIGDRIVANRGTKRVLGIGTVTGKYFFDENGGTHKHRLPVRWDDTTERVVLKKNWIKTLIPIQAKDFGAIAKAPPVGSVVQTDFTDPDFADTDPPESSALNFETILEQLREASLSFPAELVASYLLALQAKRFVLLTGISGTGKTQLALEVARAFESETDEDDNTKADALTDELVLEVRPYHRKYARFIVPADLAQAFDALLKPEVKQLEVQVPGLPPAALTVSKRADNSSLLQVLLSGKTREWFMANLQLGDRFALSYHEDEKHEWLGLRPLPHTKLATRPGGARSELIAVRPDWTDKSAILGFFNPLMQRYQSTPILRLLLRARDEVASSTETNPPRPYFLIFDEMNLARVEHYFSDFLSAMESGKGIHLHDEDLVIDRDGKEIPRTLALPQNLFVIGTVNIDETTYMFSPKVLDRAFVLEFNDVNFKSLGQTTEDEAPDSTPLALHNFESLALRGKPTEEEWQAFEKADDGQAFAITKSIHDALAVEHRHFGYRVAREIARFVDLAREQTHGDAPALRAALDVAVLAKILPKLHGSQGELEEILKKLLAIAIDAKPGSDVVSKDGKWLVDIAAAPLPRSARKLERMLRRLRARGFVSFIE